MKNWLTNAEKMITCWQTIFWDCICGAGEDVLLLNCVNTERDCCHTRGVLDNVVHLWRRCLHLLLIPRLRVLSQLRGRVPDIPHPLAPYPDGGVGVISGVGRRAQATSQELTIK